MKASRLYAIIKNDVLLKLRFKWGFFIRSIFKLKGILTFFLIYAGFFHAGGINVGGVTKENFTVFLLLGMILATFFNTGIISIGFSFGMKKWWRTIHGLLVSPATKLEIISGTGIASLVGIAPLTIFTMALAYILFPISLVKLAYMVLVVALMYLVALGIGFVKAAFVLSNENMTAWFDIVTWAIVILSCFYYPITSLPKFIQPLAWANPIYSANYLTKEIWLHGNYHFGLLIYLGIMATVSLTIGIFIFNQIWKRWGIEGY